METQKFQKELLENVYENQFTVIKQSRGIGVTTAILSYIAHQLRFNREIRRITIISPTIRTSQHILDTLYKMIQTSENFWGSMNVVQHRNRNKIILTNGNLIEICSIEYTDRPQFGDIIYVDNLSSMVDKAAERILQNIKIIPPKKVIITGNNAKDSIFNNFFRDTEKGYTQFKPLKYGWASVKERDCSWLKHQLKMLGVIKFKEMHTVV